MRLRVKQTDKTIDVTKIDYLEDDKTITVRFNTEDGYTDYYDFESLKELNDTLEDYEPVEPLIKDEKIRKAVRAWAEADDLDNFRVQNQHFNECKIIGYTAGINKASFIGFQTTIAHADNKKLYDIAELCGEEEEC